MTPRVVARALADFAHDSTAYTQGLAVQGRRLLEGTGLVGQSGVREIARESGRVIRTLPLTAAQFGEGIAVVGQRLYLSDGTDAIRVIDPATFGVVRTFHVAESGHAVWMLNELEWVHGELLANVYEIALP